MDLPVWRRFPEATAANAQEVYPGVGDPMSFDVNLIAIEHAFRTIVEQMGLAGIMGLAERTEPGFFPVFYGHVFINISANREVAKYAPGGSPEAVDEQLFGKRRNPDEPAWKPGPRENLNRLRTLAKLLPLVRRTPADVLRNDEAVEAFMQEMQAAEMSAWSDGELMATLDRALLRNMKSAEIHGRVTLFSGSGLENLRKLLVAKGFEDVDALIGDLCTGLSDIESAKPGRELSRLAAQVRADDSLREVFTGEPATIRQTLRATAMKSLMSPPDGGEAPAIPSADGRSLQIFAERFNAFLRRYGYRGVRELGMTTHVWADRPESVIALIKSYAERAEAIDPAAELREQEARRERATARVERRLSAWDRRRFRTLLKAAHEGIAGRERTKSQWVRSSHSIRLILREAGRRLTARGLIDDPEDFAYIRLRDLRNAMAGHPRPDMRALVAGYKRTKEVCERVVVPERFVDKPEARWREDMVDQTAGADVGVLRGIPVSPGRVTAKARVIKELQDEVDLEPGEVLVCPFTDAAWTPLFFNAAAVVMDLGGPLSHGSTVAREYGLPAVVNVKTGTRMIRDGQQITVDGTKGEVLLDGSLV